MHAQHLTSYEDASKKYGNKVDTTMTSAVRNEINAAWTHVFSKMIVDGLFKSSDKFGLRQSMLAAQSLVATNKFQTARELTEPILHIYRQGLQGKKL